MKKTTRIFASAILASGIFAVSVASAQVTHQIHSDPSNGAISQRYKRDAVGQPYYPSGVYSYTAAPSSTGTIPLRGDGSNAPSGSETGLGRKINAPILYFQLPELAAGGSVEDASLSFNVLSLGSTGLGAGNVDLWGLGFIAETPATFLPVSPAITSGVTQAALDVILADPAQILVNARGPELWHASDSDNRAGLGIASVVRIQDNIIPNQTPAAAGDRISTDLAGSAALGDFLEQVYAAGAQPGNWAVFRLTYDVEIDPSTGFFGYNIKGSTTTPDPSDPTLDFTTTAVPEPTALALFTGLAALGLTRRRRA